MTPRERRVMVALAICQGGAAMASLTLLLTGRHPSPYVWTPAVVSNALCGAIMMQITIRSSRRRGDCIPQGLIIGRIGLVLCAAVSLLGAAIRAIHG